MTLPLLKSALEPVVARQRQRLHMLLIQRFTFFSVESLLLFGFRVITLKCFL